MKKVKYTVGSFLQSLFNVVCGYILYITAPDESFRNFIVVSSYILMVIILYHVICKTAYKNLDIFNISTCFAGSVITTHYVWQNNPVISVVTPIICFTFLYLGYKQQPKIR